jgi:hypothetical protein
MRRIFRALQGFTVAIAAFLVIFVGFSTFLGLLLGKVPYSIPTTAFGFAIPIIGGASGILSTDELAQRFSEIAVVTAALTIVIGVLNLLFVNARRIGKGNITAKLSSAVLLFMFILTLLLYAAKSAGQPQMIDEQDGFQFLLENVQVPIESALAGLVFFSLVYGAARILREKVTPSGVLFVLTVEIVLIGALPLAGIEPLSRLTDWLINVPVSGGARGILLGIALATLVTGLRVLIGQDRTYGE